MGISLSDIKLSNTYNTLNRFIYIIPLKKLNEIDTILCLISHMKESLEKLIYPSM